MFIIDICSNYIYIYIQIYNKCIFLYTLKYRKLKKNTTTEKNDYARAPTTGPELADNVKPGDPKEEVQDW